MKNAFVICATLVAFPFCARAIDGSFNQPPIGDNPQASLIGASATLSNGVLTVTGTTQGTPTEWNHIFLGTEGNPDAGYIHSSGKKGGQGMNYLVEGSFLYRWSGLGDRKEWKWDKVATTTITRSTTANSFIVSFPVQDLNLKAGGKLQIFLATSSENYQSPLDTLPRNDSLWQIDIPAAALAKSVASAPAPAPAPVSAPAATPVVAVPAAAPAASAPAQTLAGSFSQPAVGDNPQASLIGASASLAGGVLTVTGTTQGAPTEWNHVFLGTEGNPAAGYIHSSGKKGGQGMNYLVEGGSLYRWSGLGDRTEWKWDKVGTTTVTRTTAANSFTVSFPVNDLSLKAGGKLQIFLATSNANYQTALDTLPRNDALWQIDIPASALVPPKTAENGSPAVSTPSADARARFKKITSYACYYGKDNVAQLALRDAVIIETRSQTPENVAAIKKKMVRS